MHKKLGYISKVGGCQTQMSLFHIPFEFIILCPCPCLILLCHNEWRWVGGLSNYDNVIKYAVFFLKASLRYHYACFTILVFDWEISCIICKLRIKDVLRKNYFYHYFSRLLWKSLLLQKYFKKSYINYDLLESQIEIDR